VFLGEGVVSWSSKKQSLVALSSTESEYVALSEASHEVLWVRLFLENSLGIVFSEPTAIFEDNQSAIAFAQNQCIVSRMKHIQIKYHFVRDLIENGTIELVYRYTKQMTVDVLTKPLSPSTHAYHTERLGLCPARAEGEYWNGRPLQGHAEREGRRHEGERGEEEIAGAEGDKEMGIAGERSGMAHGHSGEGQEDTGIADERSGDEVEGEPSRNEVRPGWV
jgi:hypothetical protein